MPSPPMRVGFNDGNAIPQLGLGVWQASDDQARMAVAEALQAGYRHVDTAAIYRNEVGVGAGLRDAGLPRDEVFVTTKVWNDDQGAAPARAAVHRSLERLELGHVDLLLIHWPMPRNDRYVETWRAMIELRDEGLARSIGVSNFQAPHLRRIVDETGVAPALNQIELHPYLQQHALREANNALDVRTESWSPLAQGKALDDAVIGTIARKHGKTPAQVVIRWHLDSGLIVIPKSVTPERIRANADVFDFVLDVDDMASIAALDRGERLGPDPDTFD